MVDWMLILFFSSFCSDDDFCSYDLQTDKKNRGWYKGFLLLIPLLFLIRLLCSLWSSHQLMWRAGVKHFFYGVWYSTDSNKTRRMFTVHFMILDMSLGYVYLLLLMWITSGKREKLLQEHQWQENRQRKGCPEYNRSIKECNLHLIISPDVKKSYTRVMTLKLFWRMAEWQTVESKKFTLWVLMSDFFDVRDYDVLLEWLLFCRLEWFIGY